MRITMMALFLLVSMTALGFSNETKRAPVTRVIETCNGEMSEINVAALEEAVRILKPSSPKLAFELEKMIQASAG